MRVFHPVRYRRGVSGGGVDGDTLTKNQSRQTSTARIANQTYPAVFRVPASPAGSTPARLIPSPSFATSGHSPVIERLLGSLMKPLDRLHISVHRACEKLYEDEIPPLAGQVIVSKCLPPVRCAGEEPFYAVTVVGVWSKDRMWTGPDANSVITSAADGVEAWVKEECG